MGVESKKRKVLRRRILSSSSASPTSQLIVSMARYYRLRPGCNRALLFSRNHPLAYSFRRPSHSCRAARAAIQAESPYETKSKTSCSIRRPLSVPPASDSAGKASDDSTLLRHREALIENAGSNEYRYQAPPIHSKALPFAAGPGPPATRASPDSRAALRVDGAARAGLSATRGHMAGVAGGIPSCRREPTWENAAEGLPGSWKSTRNPALARRNPGETAI